MAVPSVTSVIYAGKVFEDSPRMRQARVRGTAVHDLCEKYLLTNEVDKKAMPSNLETFYKIKPHIDEHLSEVSLIEGRCFSYKLLTAGAVDVFGVWKNRHSIVDFKTSFFPKKEENIHSYFVQTAAYAMCVSETYKVPVPPSIVVIVANDEHDQPQIFERETIDYLKDVKRIFVTNRGR